MTWRLTFIVAKKGWTNGSLKEHRVSGCGILSEKHVHAEHSIIESSPRAETKATHTGDASQSGETVGESTEKLIVQAIDERCVLR